MHLTVYYCRLFSVDIFHRSTSKSRSATITDQPVVKRESRSQSPFRARVRRSMYGLDFM